MRRLGVVLLGGLLAGCVVQTPPVDTARLSNGPVWILGDPDMWAIDHAHWALADPGRTLNRPAEAARAVAALDYRAGQINTAPRWAMIGPHSKMALLRARVEARAALGIAPDAPSQAVVDAMMTGRRRARRRQSVRGLVVLARARLYPFPGSGSAGPDDDALSAHRQYRDDARRGRTAWRRRHRDTPALTVTPAPSDYPGGDAAGVKPGTTAAPAASSRHLAWPKRSARRS